MNRKLGVLAVVGFAVLMVGANFPSHIVPEDYVIDQYPVPGTEVLAGSSVYLTYSSGPSSTWLRRNEVAEHGTEAILDLIPALIEEYDADVRTRDVDAILDAVEQVGVLLDIPLTSEIEFELLDRADYDAVQAELWAVLERYVENPQGDDMFVHWVDEMANRVVFLRLDPTDPVEETET